MPTSGHLVIGLLVAAIAARPASAAAPADVDHFERFVRPLLVERCHGCHAGDEAKGGLRLDSRAAVLAGGDSGPAIDPGKPAGDTLLVRAVNHADGLEMPPDGRLAQSQIDALTAWVAAGVPWPESPDAPALPPPASPPAIEPLAPDAPALARGLQLWLRADSLSLDDGAPVAVWPDSSGHGRDSSATKGIRPDGQGLPGVFVRESTIARRPAVRFTASTGYATSPAIPVPVSGDAAVTMAVVVNLRPTDTGPPFSGILGIGDPANPGSDPGRPLAAVLQLNRDEDDAFRFAGGWMNDASAGRGSFRPHFGRPTLLLAVKEPGPMRTTTRLSIDGRRVLPPSGEPEGRDGIPDIRHRADIGAFLGKAVSWCGSIEGDVGEAIVFDRALDDHQRVGLEAWLGEKYAIPLGGPHRAPAIAPFTPEERSHWAYQPPADPTPPVVGDTAAAPTAIDRFLQARIESLGLVAAPPADRASLLRRVTLDLTGLPPTPAETAAFLADDAPDAWSEVVNRLLASPHYGEQQARHWLDVVRFAETTANDANAVMTQAWRYRDWVIDACNRDLPYDRFLVEQLAGDLLPPSGDPAADTPRTIATGFLMIGPKALAETDKEQSRLDIVDDQIDVIGRAFLGLTLACARCHDHKFDPIRAADYYALAGIFRSTEHFQNEVRNASMWQEVALSPGAGREPITVMAPREALPRDLRVHLRGNRFQLGPLVPRGVPALFAEPGREPGGTDAPPAPFVASGGSGRLELARWIADPRHPLTARVMANRIWQQHFGRGLVATSDNFGRRGEPPSHPELLDWLARRFVESGWSVKALHRLILHSAAYRRSTAASPAQREVDPDGRALAWHPRRRLSAEQLRDAILAASGTLDRVPGADGSARVLLEKAEDIGAMIKPNRLAVDDPVYTTFTKRSVYLPAVRNMLPDVLALFDAADPNGVTAVRNETTVPSQALFLVNSPFVRAQALAFARSLLADGGLDDAGRIDRAHARALGRRATPEEIAEALAYLAAWTESPAGQARPAETRREEAWQSLCQTLLCSNEFTYLD